MKTTHTLATLFFSALFLPWSVQAQNPADSPDFFFRVIGESLKRDRPDVILKALPPSYVKDLQSLVQTFATNMDADLFNQGTGMIKDLTRVMETKKDLIMGSEMVKQSATQAGAGTSEKSWNESMAVLNALTGSDFMNLDALKKADLPNLLYKDGSKILKAVKAIDSKENPGVAMFRTTIDDLSKTSYKIAEQDGDTAKLLEMADGVESGKAKVKRVEGRWIPAEMADDWGKFMSESKEGLGAMKAQMADVKPMAMMFMGMGKGVIDKLEAAETSADIDNALGEVMGMFMGGAGGLGGEVEVEELPPGFDFE